MGGFFLFEKAAWFPRPNGAQTASASQPAASANGPYAVEIASQRSVTDAFSSWKALQARYPDLLSRYTASVKRVDLGDRGIYYNARLGPFASRDQADQLCQSLRARGGDCIVSMDALTSPLATSPTKSQPPEVISIAPKLPEATFAPPPQTLPPIQQRGRSGGGI